MNARKIIWEANYVRGITIEHVWRDLMWLCVRNGWGFVVKGGSYIGQIRLQLANAHALITNPRAENGRLAPILPPPFPPVTNEEAIEDYFQKKIIGTETDINEDYTYGEFIAPQLPRVIELLNFSQGNTNQACITIGEPSSIFLGDPPCLRVVSFKVVEGKLEMSVFFRSWDLFAGFPQNMGGLQLLKEYVLAHLEFGADDGFINCYSDGIHVYDQYFDIVRSLNTGGIVISEELMKEKEDFLRALEKGREV